jgi:hypothetical protein
MKQSYQSVLETVKEVFENRPQVNSVDDGQELEVDITKDNLWPRVFIKTIDSDFNGRWEYNFEILCLDRVNNDFSNITDVMSLTKSIIEDAISQLNFLDIINPVGITVTPFYNFQDSQSSGWEFPVTVFTTKGLECFDAVP